MNRYPIWKNTVMAVAIALGIIYTIPNFYGESPAIQVSLTDRIDKFEQRRIDKINQVLSNSGITPSSVIVDTVGIKIKFKDTDTQLKAKEVLQLNLGKEYVIALNLVSNSPRWFEGFGALPMYLGLDLRGGVHFLLQVDVKDAMEKAAERYSQDARQLLREEKVRYSAILRNGQSVEIKFRELIAREKASDLLAKSLASLLINSEDRDGEYLLILKLSEEIEKQVQEFALQQNLTTLRNRVDELGVAEPIVQQSGADRIVVQLPGVQDTAKAKDILGRIASLEVRLVDEDRMNPETLQNAVRGQIPFGTQLLYDREDTPYLLKRNIILTGERISDAQPGFDGQTGEPAVHLSLDGRGAALFQQATRENVGRRIAMILVERGQSEVVTAPVVRQEIGGGRVQISGRMTTTEARDTALLLRAGALAAPMEIIEERTVGPSLGADNIRRGFQSTWIGFVALAIFIAIYYMVFGCVSVLALVVNLTLLVSLLSVLQATLTLPGFAAIALTLGMAIDANVLINERIREEVRNGMTPHAAIIAGYERAWATILDSNITTLIAGIALFSFGSGPIRGFAVVHCLGILTSMFSAVFISRGVVNYIFGNRSKINRLPIGDTDWHKIKG